MLVRVINEEMLSSDDLGSRIGDSKSPPGVNMCISVFACVSTLRWTGNLSAHMKDG